MFRLRPTEIKYDSIDGVFEYTRNLASYNTRTNVLFRLSRYLPL